MKNFMQLMVVENKTYLDSPFHPATDFIILNNSSYTDTEIFIS